MTASSTIVSAAPLAFTESDARRLYGAFDSAMFADVLTNHRLGLPAFWPRGIDGKGNMLAAQIANDQGDLAPALEYAAGMESHHPYVTREFVLDRLVPLNAPAVEQMRAAYAELGLWREDLETRNAGPGRSTPAGPAAGVGPLTTSLADWRAQQWQQHPREMRRVARRHHQELLAALGKLRRLYARCRTYPAWNQSASPEYLLHSFRLTVEAARRTRAELGKVPS